jgi:hypothetical protein
MLYFAMFNVSPEPPYTRILPQAPLKAKDPEHMPGSSKKDMIAPAQILGVRENDDLHAAVLRLTLRAQIASDRLVFATPKCTDTRSAQTCVQQHIGNRIRAAF